MGKKNTKGLGGHNSKYVDYVLKRLGNGATGGEIGQEMKIKFNVSGAKAKAIIDTCTDLVFRVEPDYIKRTVAQIRYNTAQTLQSVDDMLETAESDYERQTLLKTRMAAVATLQKLLPARIEISGDGRDVKQMLFDLHDVDLGDDND